MDVEAALRELIRRLGGRPEEGHIGYYGRVGSSQARSLEAFSDNLRERERAVGLLETPKGASTAFLVAPSLALSCNHSFVGEENTRRTTRRDLAKSSITFDHDLHDTVPRSIEVSPSGLFVADRELDFAAFALAEPVHDRRPIPMPQQVRVHKGDDVFVIGHPAGGKQEFAFANNDVTRVRGDVIWYTADTLPGASGAPVMDFLFRLLAMHRRYGERRTYNEGVRADRITPLISHLLAGP